jgi:undecaprenyl diphosphate synthase
MNYKALLPDLDRSRLPRHIAIIMDGNGRWAKQRNRPRIYGHRAGAKSTRLVVELAVELGLEYLTFYAFSTENWSRPPDEVQTLLKLLKERLLKEIPDLNARNIHVQFIGSEDRLEPEYLAEIRSIAEMTHTNTGMRVNIAFNYGGRLEIIEGIKKLCRQAQTDPGFLESLSPESFNRFLYTAGQPDPDLIIRTSGELRLSNFLLWQSAYSEIYVTPVLWPDFNKAELLRAIIDFQNRNRRFGGVGGR